MPNEKAKGPRACAVLLERNVRLTTEADSQQLRFLEVDFHTFDEKQSSKNNVKQPV